jgi:hypothetical protein
MTGALLAALMREGTASATSAIPETPEEPEKPPDPQESRQVRRARERAEAKGPPPRSRDDPYGIGFVSRRSRRRGYS